MPEISEDTQGLIGLTASIAVFAIAKAIVKGTWRRFHPPTTIPTDLTQLANEYYLADLATRRLFPDTHACQETLP